MHWRYGRQINHYIDEQLNRHYAKYLADPVNTQTKAAIDLVMQGYTQKNAKASKVLNPQFRSFVIRQIRLFMFADHDSITGTICYILHLLFTNRDALANTRAEFKKVFGTDISAIAATLEIQAQSANHLPCTTAVIKRVMRMFTAAGCSRADKPNMNLIDDHGNHCLTEHLVV